MELLTHYNGNSYKKKQVLLLFNHSSILFYNQNLRISTVRKGIFFKGS